MTTFRRRNNFREQQHILQRQQLQRQLQLQRQEIQRQHQGVEQPRVVLQRPSNPMPEAVVEDFEKSSEAQEEEEDQGSGSCFAF